MSTITTSSIYYYSSNSGSGTPVSQWSNGVPGIINLGNNNVLFSYMVGTSISAPLALRVGSVDTSSNSIAFGQEYVSNIVGAGSTGTSIYNYALLTELDSSTGKYIVSYGETNNKMISAYIVSMSGTSVFLTSSAGTLIGEALQSTGKYTNRISALNTSTIVSAYYKSANLKIISASVNSSNLSITKGSSIILTASIDSPPIEMCTEALSNTDFIVAVCPQSDFPQLGLLIYACRINGGVFTSGSKFLLNSGIRCIGVDCRKIDSSTFIVAGAYFPSQTVTASIISVDSNLNCTLVSQNSNIFTVSSESLDRTTIIPLSSQNLTYLISAHGNSQQIVSRKIKITSSNTIISAIDTDNAVFSPEGAGSHNFSVIDNNDTLVLAETSASIVYRSKIVTINQPDATSNSTSDATTSTIVKTYYPPFSAGGTIREIEPADNIKYSKNDISIPYPLKSDMVIRVGQSINIAWENQDINNVNIYFLKGSKKLFITDKIVVDGNNNYNLFIGNYFFSEEYPVCKIIVEMKENANISFESISFKVLNKL